jgi:hypothetical protein
MIKGEFESNLRLPLPTPFDPANGEAELLI